MRKSTFVMIAVATVFGLLAAFVAQTWLNRQAEARLRSLEANVKPMAQQTLVVAAKPLRFGNEIVAASLREVPWPQDAVPPGSFKTIRELTSSGRRVVLTSIEPNEPILSTKITGTGQRATLSATINPGMKAVTIRVNDVDGVAGFVLPGDRVDIMVTRQLDKAAATNDVVLQNVRVLAIDQLADERAEKPAIAKAVTVEVEIAGAQKLSLASQIGSLSLALRKAGEADAMSTRLITLADLSAAQQDGNPPDETKQTINVLRGSEKSTYSVLREGTPAAATAELPQRTLPR
ncbi:MAG TPA: Flp pilus assembly protein CpaB [Xanthobacteraceae bacterium]|nr:Flp pilus assembly protein CpaB [Xanthobacteraceae bacterium]